MRSLALVACLLATACGSRAAIVAEAGIPPGSEAATPPLGRDAAPAPPEQGLPSPCPWNQWQCKDVLGRLSCENEGGLPPNGQDWKCHGVLEEQALRWICVGSGLSMGVPPGGCGWSCRQLSSPMLFRCEKPDGPEDRPPPGIGSHTCLMPSSKPCFTCAKGSALGGMFCEKVEGPPTIWSPSQSCQMGDRLWCDSLEYATWGQADCDPLTRKWKTKIDANGKAVLDCHDLKTAERPDTPCSCYHFYFNPVCCERLDCKVLSGIKGQVCMASPGGLCDYCNPQKSECQLADARCIITNTHESFCGQLCSSSEPCPQGYSCLAVKYGGGQKTMQCVPSDFSCYF